ncbi:hypothetical protein ACS0TY_015024 [Phlomoides rotata]
MVVDPYEDEVPKLVDDENDVVEPVGGFNDQVESSHAWITMRDNLAMQMFDDYMGRKRGGSTTRRVWTFAEECELMHALNDLVLKGNKCDNRFRSGYLLFLRTCWNMLGISGVGLNSTTYHVEALPEVWEAQIKVDTFNKSLKNKAFPFYAQWGDIFGNYRVTGQDSQLYADAVNETLQSGVNQHGSSMDVDKDDESSPATEKCAIDDPSFSVEGTSSATQDKKKGSK